MLSPTPRRLGTALVLLSWIAGYARAQSETRVDDNDSAIVYSPAGSWFRNPDVNDLDAGGHHMVTEDTTATAVFRFTGTGIRYMSALYALEINTQVRLDGGIPVVINLQDQTVPVETAGPPTVASSVLWEERGLANGEHTLEIGFAPGGLYAVVDMFIVETDGAAPTTDTTDTTPTNTDTDTSSTSSTTRTRAAAATSPTASPTPATTAALTIIIAVVCSVFGLLFLIGLLLFLARRRRQRREREAWNAMGRNDPSSSETPPLDVVDDGINAPPKQRFRSKPSWNGSLSKYYDEGPESMREVGTGGSVGGGTAGRKTPSRLRQVAVASEDGRRESWVPPTLPPKDYGIEETSRT